MQFTPHCARNVLSPLVVDKAITQSLSESECLNWIDHQLGFPSPLGRVAHRSKALDAYSITGSLDPVSIEFWGVLHPGPRGASIACSFPPIGGIGQLRDRPDQLHAPRAISRARGLPAAPRSRSAA